MPPFERAVAEHGPVVLRVCRAMLRSGEADDAWSDTFLAALKAYPSLLPDSNVRGWLVTIAHRKCLDVIRRRTPAGTAVDDLGEIPGGDVIPPPADEELRGALLALPPKQRGAVVYRYLADLPYAEVAALLDSSEPAARRSAADGIANLRKTYLQGARP